ncbi:MAG: GNAT family N-acetyltransferase [Pyrinomonadaceae bacterium]|nr:GNAT family N-acetyltransferase [Pyrinomonadaceae bacterium]
MSDEDAANRSLPVTLRPTGAEDEAFLLDVYSSTRADEMAQAPWSEAQRAAFLQMQFTAQQRHYQAHFPKATHDVILFDKQPAGRLYVDRRDAEIRILDIALLPDYRKRGIGFALIKALMNESAEAGKSLAIYVESYNPSRQLFERLGFLPIEDDGLNLLFEWRSGS